MGHQQILLIILGVIIVGIAIAVGIILFSANNIQSNKDAILNDINNIAADAYRYRIRPASMGGGQNSYTGYKVLPKMSNNENATYDVTLTAVDVAFKAISAQNAANTVEVKIDSLGKFVSGSWTYAGDFQ
ncbi:MAG: hypothetical protein V1799_11910 [bacterium]